MSARYELPFTTRITGADLLDLDVTSLRIPDIENVFRMLNMEGPQFWRVLDTLARGEDKTQALYHWREDDTLNNSTAVTAAANATATSISVGDAKMFVVNSYAYCPRTLEAMLVTGVDYTNNTITVTRGFPDGSTSAALTTSDVLIVGTAQLAERASANAGNSWLPAGLKYNYVGFFSETVTVSHRQDVSDMVVVDGEEVGTMDWAVKQKMVDIMKKMNRDLLFSRKGITSTADDDITSFDGFYAQLDSNILTLDGSMGTMDWRTFSDYIDRLCEPDASSDEKMVFAGNNLYSSLRRCAREAGVETGEYWNPSFGATGANSMEMLSEEGRRLVVVRDKYGFSANAGMAGNGIVVDMANIEIAGYTQTPLAWRQNIQDNDSHVLKDEIWGSLTLQLYHSSTHGAIFDAPGKAIPSVRY
jgi:hypothetical protein